MEFPWEVIYFSTFALLLPCNLGLALLLRRRFRPGSVLHISHMVHIPYFTTRLLRAKGIPADYMAIGRSFIWDACDYRVTFSRFPFVRPFQEMWWCWVVARRYEIVHSHFMVTVSYGGWEIPFLKWMGRKLLVHYRGCDIRAREKNMRLHPEVNICQECDYLQLPDNRYTCELPRIHRRRKLMRRYADFSLVTTPDLREFIHEAKHFPFFTPVTNGTMVSSDVRQSAPGAVTTLIHATNHPGIEGTKEIEAVVKRLQSRGYRIEFRFLTRMPYERVIEEYHKADLSVGKMKMGYYANAQIESMYCGVPAITYVREEFITPQLRDSGFILTSLSRLEETLEYYLTHREELIRKKSIAKTSVLRLHDNASLVAELIALYQQMCRKD